MRLCCLLGAALLAGCAAPETPWLHNVGLVQADGSVKQVKELSKFQELMRARLPKPKAGGWGFLGGGGMQVSEVVAVEADMPEGEGWEGYYVAVVRKGKETEIDYIEQVEHLPRVDRYFHRVLTATEAAEVRELLSRHPLGGRQEARQAVVPSAGAAPGGEEMPEAPEAVPMAQYLLWEADTGRTKMLEDMGAMNDPAHAWTQTLTRLLDPPGGTTEAAHAPASAPASAPGATEPAEMAPGETGAVPVMAVGAPLPLDPSAWQCTYVQPIPPTARLLYADPYRRVLAVWSKEGELRVLVTGVERPLQRVSGPPVWLAYREGKWVIAEEPMPAETEPASAPATAPSTQAAMPALAAEPATQGAETQAASGPATSRFSNPHLLPEEESWWSEPARNGGSYTTVYHYMLLSPTFGQTAGFVVPSFVFDDEHMAVNVPQKTLYLIHDGQLFALPIPAVVMMRR